MPTLTHCPECGVPFDGKVKRDPTKHYRYHYPEFNKIPADPEHYLARKRAIMLLTNDSDAEPPGGIPNVPMSVPPQEETEDEEAPAGRRGR